MHADKVAEQVVYAGRVCGYVARCGEVVVDAVRQVVGKGKMRSMIPAGNP